MQTMEQYAQSKQVQETDQFFQQKIKEMNDSLLQIINDQVLDLQYQQDVFTQEEVQKILQDQLAGEQKLKMIKNQQELVKLIHALILQLQGQAKNQIYPNPDEFQDQKLIQLYQNKKQQDNGQQNQGMEILVKQQQMQIEQLQNELKQYKSQKNVDIENLPQYKNLQKMIQNLQKKLAKYEENE